MVVGIPRGYFYYEYFGFMQRLFAMKDGSNSGFIKLLIGSKNNDKTLEMGSAAAVDEACLPIKLIAGQAEMMSDECDFIFVPRILKDYGGMWLCPKLLGLPELLSHISAPEKLLITEPLNFQNKKETGRRLWKACHRMGMRQKDFYENFESAYEYQKSIYTGKRRMHVEAAWEFTPTLEEGEIILPNTGRVLLAGHCYNIYDEFASGKIMSRLDELGFDVVTEREVSYSEKREAVKRLGLIKKPFWEALIRNLGTAICLKDEIEGIVYLSSFSCGPDAVIIELIRKYAGSIPLLVVKIDEHKGYTGLQTRLEAFADLLERRRAS